MRYIEGIQRSQAIMFPETLDEYVTEENVVRFIDDFVDSLDLKEMNFTYSEPKETGRKPYNPGDMLKLYIYGYLKKIRSSRQLEAETQRNLELMWLINKLTPDFKTIADFRRDNTKAIKRVCREFIVLCKKLNLFASELVAIDGSKFRAANSKENSYSSKRLKIILSDIDRAITNYLNEIERTDKEEVKIKKINKEELAEIIKGLEHKKAEVKEMLKEIEEGDEEQISKTDSDSRMMRTTEGNQVSYNVQMAVEGNHHLIVEYEVTNEQNDLNCLSMMAEKTKETLGTEELKVVCDTGYFNKKEIGICEDKGIECYIPQARNSSNENEGRFRLEEFTYDKVNDRYVCPAAEELNYRGKHVKQGMLMKRYGTSKCKRCPIKSECTNSRSNRYLDRWEREEIIEAMQERMRRNKDMMRKRKSIIEHVFGTIKHWMGYKYLVLLI